MLGDEHAASDREAHPKRNEQEHHREREADRRQRLRRVLPQPERVRQIVGGLHQVREHDGQREEQQWLDDATLCQVEFLLTFEEAHATTSDPGFHPRCSSNVFSST